VWMQTSAGGMPGPKLQLMESSVGGVFTLLPPFMRQMMIALREAGAYSFLSMGAVIVLARRMIMQKDQMRIDGKLVLVNGATSRLGCELCAQLSRRGANIIMVGAKGRPMESYKTQIEDKASASAALIFTRECNCSDGKSVEAMVREVTTSIGVPDVVIQLVEGSHRPLTGLSHQQVRDDFEEAMLPLPYLARSLLRSMLQKRAGAIVLVQSAVSRGHWQNSTLMVAAGWGLRGLLGALSADLAGTHVMVQEVVLPYEHDQLPESVERTSVRDAAAVISALENRLPLSFAGVPKAVPEAVYPVVCHFILMSLPRVFR